MLLSSQWFAVDCVCNSYLWFTARICSSKERRDPRWPFNICWVCHVRKASRWANVVFPRNLCAHMIEKTTKSNTAWAWTVCSAGGRGVNKAFSMDWRRWPSCADPLDARCALCAVVGPLTWCFDLCATERYQAHRQRTSRSRYSSKVSLMPTRFVYSWRLCFSYW